MKVAHENRMKYRARKLRKKLTGIFRIRLKLYVLRKAWLLMGKQAEDVERNPIDYSHSRPHAARWARHQVRIVENASRRMKTLIH